MGNSDALGQYGHQEHGENVYGGYSPVLVTETGSVTSTGAVTGSNESTSAVSGGATVGASSVGSTESTVAKTAGASVDSVGRLGAYSVENSSTIEIAESTNQSQHGAVELASSVDYSSTTFNEINFLTPQALVTEDGGVAESTTAALTGDTDLALVAESSLAFSEGSNLVADEYSNGVSNPVTLIGDGVFIAVDKSTSSDSASTTAFGAIDGVDSGRSSDTPTITATSQIPASAGENASATVPVSESISSSITSLALQSFATDTGGLTGSAIAGLVENADGALAEEISVTFSEDSRFTANEVADVVSDPVSSTGDSVFGVDSVFSYPESGSVTASGVVTGRDSGISTDTPSVTATSQTQPSTGESATASVPTTTPAFSGKSSVSHQASAAGVSRMAGSGTVGVVGNADEAGVTETSVEFSNPGRFTVNGSAGAIIDPITLIGSNVLFTDDRSKWLEDGSATASSSFAGVGAGISTDSPAATASSQVTTTVGEVTIATSPVSEATAVGQMGTTETSAATGSAKVSMPAQFSSASTGSAVSAGATTGGPVYRSGDHAIASTISSTTGVHTSFVGEEMIATDRPSVTGQNVIDNISNGIIYESGAAQSASSVWTTGTATGVEYWSVTGGGDIWTEGATGATDQPTASGATNASVKQESASSVESPSPDHSSSTAATETASAQPVVGMSANGLPFSTASAGATNTASLTATSPLFATATAIALTAPTTTSQSPLLASDVAGVLDGALVTASTKQQSPVSTSGTDGGVVESGTESRATGSGSGTDSGRSTATFDPRLSPLAIANGAGPDGGPLSTSATPTVSSVTAIGSVMEFPDAVGVGQMASPTSAHATTFGSITTGHGHLVLEGPSSVSTEISVMTATSKDTMDATEYTRGVDIAPMVSSGNVETSDSAVVMSSPTVAGDYIPSDVLETATAGDSPTVIPPRDFSVDEYGASTDGSIMWFEDNVGVVDLGLAHEGDTGLTEDTHVFTLEQSLAQDGPSVIGEIDLADGELEYAPTIPETARMSNPPDFRANGWAFIHEEIEPIVTGTEPTLSDVSTVVESVVVLGDGIVLGANYIPGLRTTVSILGNQKGYIYATDTSSTRRVLLGDASDESIKVGPQNDIRIRSDTD